MVKTVTIIRHGQSKQNAGQCKNNDELRNCALSDFGKEQAKKLEQNFDVVLVSPLRRAIETYENSNIKTDNLIHSDLFREHREHNLSEFLENEEIIPEHDVRQRARDAFAFIKELNYNNIGIVTHLCFSWYLLEQCGQPVISLENTQSITFTI